MHLPILCKGYTSRFSCFLIFFLSYFSASAQTQPPYFGPTFSVGNTQGRGETGPGNTVTDAQGNVYVTGEFIGTLTFGTQQLTSRTDRYYDVFVAKFDAAGNYLWAVQAGSEGSDYGSAIALDANGNVYITGYFLATAKFGAHTLAHSPANDYDVFVAKLDVDGNWLWAVSNIGPGDDYSVDIAVDAGGIITVFGAFLGTTATFGPTQLTNVQPIATAQHDTGEIFVARLTAAGSWLGAVSAGGNGHDFINSGTVDAVGNAYISGSFDGTSLRFGLTTLTNATPGTPGPPGAYVAKVAPDGTWEWAVSVGNRENLSVGGIAVDQAGLIYLTGGIRNSSATFGSLTLTLDPGDFSSVFVASLNNNGTWRWATKGGTNGFSADLVLDKSGQPVITGSFNSSATQFGTTKLVNTSSADNYDVFIAKLSTTGSWQWAMSSTGAHDEAAYTLAAASDGGIWLMGSYRGEPTFGTTTLTGNPVFSNLFLTKVYDSYPLPTIATHAPSSGAAGQAVSLTGTGFVDVIAVLFNGIPATAFTLKSATQLEAIVPPGITSGPISVRTNAGTGNSVLSFQALILAATVPAEATFLQLWPNPARSGEAIELRLPDAVSLSSSTRMEVRNSLGQIVQQSQFKGRSTSLLLPNLPPGVYQLSLMTAKQQPLRRPLIIY